MIGAAQPSRLHVTNDTPRYMRFPVLDHVQAALEAGDDTIGWRISDALESDPEGDDQTFTSREAPIDPPEMTLPLLRLIYETDNAADPLAPEMNPGTTPRTDIICGEVITEDTILGKDLEDCPGEGIVIGAPNIVLDLNGHWIDGPDYLLGNITGQEEGFPGGIRNAGHTNVLVTNSKGIGCGTVQPDAQCEGGVKEFGYGVLLAGTTFNVVENLIVQQNAMAGIELNDADDGRHGNTIRNNYIRDNELGVDIINDAYGSLIENNKIYGSLGEAIYIEFSNGHTVKGNEIVGVPFNPMLDSDGGFLLHSSSDNVIIGNTLRDTGDAGLVITQGSDNNRVGGPRLPGQSAGEGEGNKMWNNGDAGIYIQDSLDNQVINNMAHQESDGGVVINEAHGTVIRDNDLRFNPNGIETADSNDIKVIGNDASDAQADGFAIGNGINVVIQNNIANRTGGAGIGFEGTAFDALGLPVGTGTVQGNTTNENLADGIEIADGGGHLIADNTAFNNQGHGIVAEGNVDGGGNIAAGNGAVRPDGGNPPEPPDPTFPQCLGVECAFQTPPPWSVTDTEAPNALIIEGPVGPAPVPLLPNQLLEDRQHVGDIRVHRDGQLLPGERARLRVPPRPAAGHHRAGRAARPRARPARSRPRRHVGSGSLPRRGLGACISPVHFHNLEAGTHRFEVMVRDQADPEPNLDLTPVVYHWDVDLSAPGDFDGPDTTNPDTFIVRAPDGATIDTMATFRFLGSDNQTPGVNLTYECRRYHNTSTSITAIPDGILAGEVGAWGPCTSPIEYPGRPRSRRRVAPLRGALDRHEGQRGQLARGPQLADPRPAGRHHAAGDHHPDRPRPGHGAQERDVHVHRERAGRHLRVRALPAGPLGATRSTLHVAGDVRPGHRRRPAPRAGRAQVLRPGEGSLRERRSDARRVHLVRVGAAGPAERVLRTGHHPEHARPERPRRLPLRRPRHRR